NNDKTQVEIGDVVYTASTKRQSNINSKLNNMENDLSNRRNELSHELVSADGKNTINYGNSEPERKRVGDSWVRDHPSLAGETQWLVWNGEAWELILDTSETTLNKEAIEQAKQDIEEAKQTADEAVEQIDTAVANAGFTSLDETISSVQTISNQAQINAGTAIDNALEAMQQASQAVDNTGSLNVRVDEVENTLSVKADKQTVDDLTGVVDLQALDIKANADGLKLKANQDTVDLIDGRVSSLGTEVGVVAGQISSKVWKTDIESAVDGIEVGGRNYFARALINNIAEASGELRSDGNWKGYSFSVNEGEQYTIHRTDTTNNRWRLYWVYTDEVEGSTTHTTAFSDDSQDSNVPNTVKVPIDAKWGHLYLSNNDSDGSTIPNIMIEKGNKATDWTPAPEDTDAKIDHIETEWTQTFDSFSQTVSSIDGRVSKQEQTVSGMQSVVYDPETGLSSLN